MKKIQIASILAFILAILLMVNSAAATTKPDRQEKSPIPIEANSPTINGQTIFLPITSFLQAVGERIFIYYSGSQTFPANTPFHIVHGWLLGPEDEHPELFDFQLQVDGIYQKVDIIEVRLGEYRQYVFNFPTGMTGVHFFKGHWFAPCGAVYDNCVDPNEIVETGTSIVDVTFIP